MNRQDRFISPNCQQELITSCAAFHSGIATLDRVKPRSAGTAGRHRGCCTTAHTDTHTGTTELDQQTTHWQIELLVCMSLILPIPPAIMIGFVITMHRTTDVLFVSTEAATNTGRPNSLLKRFAPPMGPSIMICKGSVRSGLPCLARGGIVAGDIGRVSQGCNVAASSNFRQ